MLEEIDSQIDKLEKLSERDGLDFSQEIARLQEKLTRAKKEKKRELNDWERVKLARHPNRPSSRVYIDELMDEFYELHGDRLIGDDKALVGGLAKFRGRSIVVLAQQKGRDAEESKECNFGMVHPEGYRKARRLMELAENFSFPLFTFIDTPGAYPGKKSEENNIGGAIARSIQKLLGLRVPTLATIIGEGGSGGAVAIGATDRVLMMENSIYSVISPEGCAAILWKDKDKAEEAANSLKLTASHVEEMGLIDEVIKEEDGGAHENFEPSAKNLANSLERHINELVEEDVDSLLEKRKKWYRSIGTYNKVE
mgnify:CR=1 FL=1